MPLFRVGAGCAVFPFAILTISEQLDYNSHFRDPIIKIRNSFCCIMLQTVNEI